MNDTEAIVRALTRIADSVEAINGKVTTAAEDRARLVAKAAEIRAQREQADAETAEAPAEESPVAPRCEAEKRLDNGQRVRCENAEGHEHRTVHYTRHAGTSVFW